MSRKIMFLDFDGVVNTPMWTDDGSRVRFNFPEDGKVNNFQAVKWISHFCEEFGFDIVVSSTWRMDKNWKECLVNGGLSSKVNIVGCTPISPLRTRGHEINTWLENNSDVNEFIIIDDVWEFFYEQQNHTFIVPRPDFGFGQEDFFECKKKFENGDLKVRKIVCPHCKSEKKEIYDYHIECDSYEAIIQYQ